MTPLAMISLDEGGTLFGAVVKGNAGPVGLGLGFQLADKEFVGGTENATHVTLTGKYGNAYAVYNIADDGTNNPQYGTVGYTLNIGSASLMYFEYQFNDNDTAVDNESILRATYKFDFGV